MKNTIGNEERREYRRKRRVRNQIIAYAVLFVMIALVSIGSVEMMKRSAMREQAIEETHENNMAMIDEMIAEEEEIIVPPATTPKPTEPPKTQEDLFEEELDAMIAAMPLEDKVAGLFIVTPEAITGVNTAVKAGSGTQKALEQYAVGGMIYFKKNIKSEKQLKEMIEKTKEYSRYPLFIAIDEEGGKVSRLADARLVERQPTAKEIGATGTESAAYEAGVAIGTYLSEYGFNLNFAPVADLSNVENSIMKDRAFGADAETTSPYVVSMMTGMQEQGITACLKHFPGIGSTTQDTHNGLASIERSIEEICDQELWMFESGMDGGAQMIMVGHASCEALSGDLTPASMSPAIVTDVLRNDLNFQGIIITDALNMSAISEYYSSEQAAVMAIKAGCDMVLMPENFKQAYNGVLNAVKDGTISEERINDSLKRIYRVKLAGQTIENE